MGNRRKARELALQALFCLDINRDMSEVMLARFCDHFQPPDKVRGFFHRLATGTIRLRPQIDRIIEEFSKNWKIGRMSCVDRNILRLAVFEMLFCHDIPQKVSINEAIDIAKRYGTEDSGAFINGILDSIRLARETEEFDRIGELESSELPSADS
jgi:N utilization substance protein B